LVTAATGLWNKHNDCTQEDGPRPPFRRGGKEPDKIAAALGLSPSNVRAVLAATRAAVVKAGRDPNDRNAVAGFCRAALGICIVAAALAA
jgi:hypothetical protein